MGRICVSLRRHCWLAVVACCALLAAGLWPAKAAAQVAGLDDPGRWDFGEVRWRDSGGLPVDQEFAAPLVAQYNWGYGMTVLGLNVKSVGSADHYAALGLYNGGYLDAMTTIGPLPGASVWDAGPFHVAAGLPDGRLIVWLTAPGELPKEVQITGDYQSGTAIDVTVYTPDPANTVWSQWWICAVYQRTGVDQSIAVINQDGNGRQISNLGLVGIPGLLESVAYLDYPVAGVAVPLLLMTVARDDTEALGNNEHLLAQAAYYEEQGGWYVQTLRNAGIKNGAVYLGYGEAAQLLLAYDESDSATLTSGLQQINFTNAQAPSAGLTLNGFDLLNFTADYRLWAYFSSARTANQPMVVASDSVDVYLGFHVPRAGRVGNELGFNFFRLFQGEGRQESGRVVPQYPIIGVAGTSHWSSGNPELFMVQKGSQNHAGGQLYRMHFTPPARR